MPNHTVQLTDELERFVRQNVDSGRFENPSEVVHAALTNFVREDEEHQAKLSALRGAIDEGDASGIAEGNVFERVRASLRLPATRA